MNGARLVYRQRTRRGNGFKGRKGWFIGDTALSEHETTLLFAIMCRRKVTTAEAIETIWPNPDFEPDWATYIVGVVAFRLRNKLAPYGWDVRSPPGLNRDAPDYGYRLTHIPVADAERIAA